MNLKATTNIHGQSCLQIDNTSEAQHAFIRRLIGANHMDDPEYHIRINAHAFFQCGSNEESGYILIEFWTKNKDAIQAFVDYVNANMPED